MLLGCITWSSAGYATLIGDTVILEHRFPTVSQVAVGATGQLQRFVVDVEAGNQDTTLFLEQISTPGFTYSVNVEAESILVNFLLDNRVFNSTPTFNGLFVTDLDWVGVPNGKILGVSIDTNFAGWTDSRIVFGDDFVGFNWRALPFSTSTYFTANLGTSHSPIPEPSTMLLMGTGLLVMILYVWRRERLQQS